MPQTQKTLTELQLERLDAAERHAQSVAAEISDAFQTPSSTAETDVPLPEAKEPCSCPNDHPCRCASAAPVAGLPVAGYRPTQEPWRLELVNVNKLLEEVVLRQVDLHVRNRDSADIDQREVALARTKFEEAFSHLNRGVFQPNGSRITTGPVADLAGVLLDAARGKAVKK